MTVAFEISRTPVFQLATLLGAGTWPGLKVFCSRNMALDVKVASVPQTCLLASKLAASLIGLRKLTKGFFWGNRRVLSR